MNDPTKRAEAILNVAIQLPTAEQRAAYLMGACGHDDQLRQRVEDLMRGRQKADGPHQVNPADEVRTVISERPLTEEPGTLIDRYKLLAKIGEGGFGAVY